LADLCVFRICPRRYLPFAFSGDGARLNGGRWNEKGTRLVYCASSASLAMLEILVHTPTLPAGMVLIPVTIPRGLSIVAWKAAELPTGWSGHPAPAVLQARGSAWVKTQAAVALQVPSAVAPRETNLLINPEHPDWSRCVVGEPEPIQFDRRLRP
jgi:RES domain-containing protein